MFAIYSKGAATLILRGKPYTLSADHPRYDDLVAAINAKNEDDALSIVTAHDTLAEVLGVFGDVTVFCGHVSHKGRHLPANYLAQQILAFQKEGRDIEPLARFLDQALANPDPRAAADLYHWCEANQMPIGSDGRIIGYKIVRENFFDIFTGTFDNSPGKVVQQDRSICNPDPDVTCAPGLHFCSAPYLPQYGSYGGGNRVVLVAVSPTDVVAFPRDYGFSKARGCKHEVLHEVDRETAGSFFSHGPLVYDGLESEVDFSEDKTFAEARGYRVIYDGDGDYDWRDQEDRSADDYLKSEAEAWADAAQDARELNVQPLTASVTTTMSATADGVTLTNLSVTGNLVLDGSIEVPFWAAAVENHPATRIDIVDSNTGQSLDDRLNKLVQYLGLGSVDGLTEVEQNLGLSHNVHQSLAERYAACERIVGFQQ
jgi:hypothetical protein